MLSKLSIDINADVGEGLNNESQLMPYLSSCNIACGGHAGNAKTMLDVVKLAKQHNVKIGAHPSFPDKENFGRVNMDISREDLYTSLQSQIDSLRSILNSENLKLYHIKPHGALYNLAAKDENIATIILDVLESFSFKLKLYAPYKSVISKLAKQRQIEVVFEGFADRNYNEDLSLVSRQKSDALITEKEAVFSHAFKMIFEQKVRAINGVEVSMIINTICVHGDTENSREILKYLHTEFINNNIEIH